MPIRKLWWACLAAAPLILLSPAAWSQDSPDVVARFDALSRKISRGNGQGPDAKTQENAVAYDLLEWNGLLWLGRAVNAKEAEAGTKLDAQAQSMTTLNAEFDKLVAAAGNKDSNKGTGGIGKPGLGWYCQRATEMIPELGRVSKTVEELARKASSMIRGVPLGEGSESTRKVSEIATSFDKGLQQILTQPSTRSMIKDLRSVADGLTPGAAVSSTNDAGTVATTAAYELRKQGNDLQKIGVALVPMLKRYVEARLELGQEIAALTPLVKDPGRAASLNALAINVRDSRKPPYTRSPDEWQKLIATAVDKGSALANQRLDAIAKLKDPASTELQACKGEKDLPGAFGRARQAAYGSITGAQSLVEVAVHERSQQIALDDRKLDQAIRKFESTETDAAAKAKQVYAQLQVGDRKSPEWREKEQQYDRLEAIRKNARNAIESIREQRNEYVKEQQNMKQMTGKAATDLSELLAQGPGGK